MDVFERTAGGADRNTVYGDTLRSDVPDSMRFWPGYLGSNVVWDTWRASPTTLKTGKTVDENRGSRTSGQLAQLVKSLEEWEALIQKTGWRLDRALPTGSPSSLLEAICV